MDNVERIVSAGWASFLRRLPWLASNVSTMMAGTILFVASFLPWLRDPFGKSYSAWNLPLDFGWQIRGGVFNYGLLCVCCAAYCFYLAYAAVNSQMRRQPLARSRVLATIICCLPTVLFFLQYLFISVDQLDNLAQRKIQMLLIQQHFGYRVGSQLFSIPAFSINVTTAGGRLQLLIGLMTIVPLLPCISTLLLRSALKSQFTLQVRSSTRWIVGILLLFLLLVAGRAAAVGVCEDQAENALSAGNYSDAIGWLDKARVLNPLLDATIKYHQERGQALYYLYPFLQSDDTRLYLASVYAGRGETLDAYQQLLAIVQEHTTSQPAWALNEMSVVLERLVESSNVVKSSEAAIDAQAKDLKSDQAAFNWLQSLTYLDPGNLYSHYMMARIAYNMHDYMLCIQLMNAAISSSSDSDLVSSAYTFMALSHAGQDDYAGERSLLLLAVKYDPQYHNNTAREEVSGLR